MNAGVRPLATLFGAAALTAAVALAQDQAQAPPAQRPRPGLTAQQTKQAVELARGAMQELRKKTEGASEPEADRREYVVNVELLNAKDDDSPDAEGRRRRTSRRRSRARGPS